MYLLPDFAHFMEKHSTVPIGLLYNLIDLLMDLGTIIEFLISFSLYLRMSILHSLDLTWLSSFLTVLLTSPMLVIIVWTVSRICHPYSSPSWQAAPLQQKFVKVPGVPTYMTWSCCFPDVRNDQGASVPRIQEKMSATIQDKMSTAIHEKMNLLLPSFNLVRLWKKHCGPIYELGDSFFPSVVVSSGNRGGRVNFRGTTSQFWDGCNVAVYQRDPHRHTYFFLFFPRSLLFRCREMSKVRIFHWFRWWKSRPVCLTYLKSLFNWWEILLLPSLIVCKYPSGTWKGTTKCVCSIKYPCVKPFKTQKPKESPKSWILICPKNGPLKRVHFLVWFLHLLCRCWAVRCVWGATQLTFSPKIWCDFSSFNPISLSIQKVLKSNLI